MCVGLMVQSPLSNIRVTFQGKDVCLQICLMVLFGKSMVALSLCECSGIVSVSGLRTSCDFDPEGQGTALA